MPLSVLVTLSLQKAIDILLAKNPQAIAQCEQLKEKVIQFHIQGFSNLSDSTTGHSTVYVLILKDGLEIMTEYDYQPDVEFTGLPSGYIALSKDSKKALVDKVISVKGDFNVGQQFSDLIDSIELDLVALTSLGIGEDLATHFFANNKPNIFKKVAEFKQKQWKDILQNKLNVLPVADEVTSFKNQISSLTPQVDRLDKTIQRLTNKVNNV